MVSEGYLDPEGPIPGMTTVRSANRDPFGLWIRRKQRDIPWRWCPLLYCQCAIPAACIVCPFCATGLVFTPAPVSGVER
eukprot:8786923-Heterocapsa_arctica.AAC.1